MNKYIMLIIINLLIIPLSCATDDYDYVNDVVGTWYYESNDDKYTTQITYIFNEDLTMSYDIKSSSALNPNNNSSATGVYSISNNSIKITYDFSGNTEESYYVTENNKLTIVFGDSTLTFTKQ